MGLDQAVLQGFENGSGEGALTKTEVEKLLRHGAYAIISEEKDGKGESASTEFVQQDIDSILERRTRTIVHDSGAGAQQGGSTFSKASFKVSKSPNKLENCEDVDIDDPEFWKKMLGDAYQQNEISYLDPKQRRRLPKNYSEDDKQEEDKISSVDEVDPDSADVDYNYESDETSEHDDDESVERAKWGGSKTSQWDKDDVEKVERFLYSFGYGNIGWDLTSKFLGIKSKGEHEVSLQRRQS